MTGMLNTLLDINRIEAGAVNGNRRLPDKRLFDRLREELTYHVQATASTYASCRAP